MAAHKAWRLKISEINGATIAQTRGIDLMFASVNQSDDAGTPFSQNASVGSNPLTNVFDEIDTTDTFFSGMIYPFNVGKVFNTAIDVDEYRVGSGAVDSRSFKSWDLEYSDDTITNQAEWNNATWTVEHSVTGETGWTVGEFRTFTIGTPPVTWDPATALANLSNGDLTLTGISGAWRGAQSTTSHDASGKYYAEITVETSISLSIGLGTDYNFASVPGSTGDNIGINSTTGQVQRGGANVGTPIGAVQLGDILQVLYDADAGTVEFARNNTSFSTAISVTNNTTAQFLLGAAFGSASSSTVNFGATAFTHALPTNYQSWDGSQTGGVTNVTEEVSQDFSYQQQSAVVITDNIAQDFSYQQEEAIVITDNVGQDFSYQQDAALITTEYVAQDFSYLQEALIPITEYVAQDFSYLQEELTLLTDNVAQDFSYLQESAQTVSQGIAQDFSYLQEDSTVTNVALSDSIALTDLGLGFDIIFQLRSAMALQDAFLAPANFTVPLQDFIALDDLVNLGLLGTLSDGMSLSDSPEALIQFLATLAEQLSMSDSTQTTAEIVGNLTDAMTLADLILGGLIGDLSESFTLNDQIVEVISAWEAIQEALTISLSSSTGTLIVIGLLTDQLSLDDTLSAGQALQEALKDGIAMMSLPPEISDDGRIGWVMNPETFAVWNYDNMNFNSLTFYQETGLMASSTGLYKSNDSAVDTNTLDPVANPLLVTRITSSLKTPSLNFGTSSLKQVPKMYLGLDMDGEITLVVNTDEKVKVRYQLKKPTDHSHVQEMQIGKGLIGSQWQFELIDSTSDDFELNFIEILPVVFGRKTR